MKFHKIMIFWMVLVAIFLNTMAQCKTKIQGKIIDKQTNMPLSFVNVIVLGTERGTMADANGYYELSLPTGSYELMFSMIGYKTFCQKINLRENQTLNYNVLLSPTVLYMPGVTIITHKTAQQKQNESVSSLSFETKKIRDLPFSLNDINRALKTLPGISSNNEKSSEFNVRGGIFEENLVLVDGVTIYRPFHLKAMPNASISIFNMALMKRVNLVTGGFTAKFGDKMSSVLEIEYRNGNNEQFKSQIEVGVVNTNILFEGPLGSKCSWITGFNKSYFEPSMKIMNYYFPEFLEEISGIPKYYDIQGKVNYKINPQQQVSLLFLNAGDEYCAEPRYYNENYIQSYKSYYSQMETKDKSKFEANFSNSLLALQLSNRLMNTIFSNTTFSYYDEMEDMLMSSKYNVINKYYNRNSDEYLGFSNYNNIDMYEVNLHIKTLEFKNDVTFKITPFHEFETGFNFKHIRYLYQLNDLSERITFYHIANYPDTIKIDTLFYEDNYNDKVALKSRTYKISAYFMDNWQITDNIFVNIGLRCDYFDFNRNLTFSPRISCSYTFDKGGIIKLAWGHYYQSPMYYEFKLKTACSNNTQNQKAVHYIVGYQQKVTNLFDLKIDCYYKDYQNIIPYYLRSGYKLSIQKNNAIGFAKGIDIQLKYDLIDLSGWFSYGFMVARERIIDDGESYYPRSTDQRHSLAMIIDWNITDKWRVYGKFLYGSGFPYTPSTFDIESHRFVPGKINSEYLPPYKRVDLRFSRYFSFAWGNCDIYLEVINVFNNKNIFTYQHYGFDEYGNVTKEAKRLLPFTPNIGLKITL